MSGLCTCTKGNLLAEGQHIAALVHARAELLQAQGYSASRLLLCRHIQLVARLSHLDAFHCSFGYVLLDGPVSPAAGNPCAEQCRLRVYPDMDDGSACQDCASQHLGYWHYTRFASIDLLWGKAYGQDSVLMGTTQSHINSIVEAILHAEGINVKL